MKGPSCPDLLTISLTALVVAVMILVSLLAPREVAVSTRDLRFDTSMRKLCDEYQRWSKLAGDRVEGMDRHCLVKVTP